VTGTINNPGGQAEGQENPGGTTTSVTVTPPPAAATPPPAQPTPAPQQPPAQANTDTGRTSGQPTPVEDFDEDEDGNGEDRFVLTRQKLKERLERRERRVAERYQREKDAAQAALDEERRKAEEARLESEKKFQDLAEQRLTRITELDAKVKELEGRLGSEKPYRERVEKLLKDALKEVPEEFRELLEDMEPLRQFDWITKYRAKTLKPAPPAEPAEPEPAEPGKNGAAPQSSAPKQSRPIPQTPHADGASGVSPEDLQRGKLELQQMIRH
jgi:hypothetical protein